jgi:hypothetical protein
MMRRVALPEGFTLIAGCFDPAASAEHLETLLGYLEAVGATTPGS